MSTPVLPLFPLHSVLLPGARLQLRVVEPRYMDMVRECGRSGSGFGVCLMLEGAESGTPHAPAAFGTEALIEDFANDGVLTLHVRGARRFHVRRTRVRDSGLIVAEVAWCQEMPTQRLQPQHALLGDVLQRILDQLGGEFAHAPKADFEDAAWVAWRLTELLPLTDTQRQGLLQENDPHLRLQQLLEWMI